MGVREAAKVLAGETKHWLRLGTSVSWVAGRIVAIEVRDALLGREDDELQLDPIDDLVGRIDRQLAETDRLDKHWAGYVARELKIAGDGVRVARRAVERGESDDRVRAMPEASLVHAADVVSRGLGADGQTRFRTTAQDVAEFLMLAVDVMPDGGLHQLRLEPGHHRTLEQAIWLHNDAWAPYAE